MFAGIETGAHAYFVHSYVMRPADAGACSGHPDYGGPFTAAVGRDNIVGTQFHPEKSQAAGLSIARQFSGLEAVILFPAIDLKDGCCVRLKRGEMDERHGLQRRSGGAGARLCASRVSMAALRGSEWRL